jgi:hypothetical protein
MVTHSKKKLARSHISDSYNTNNMLEIFKHNNPVHSLLYLVHEKSTSRSKHQKTQLTSFLKDTDLEKIIFSKMFSVLLALSLIAGSSVTASPYPFPLTGTPKPSKCDVGQQLCCESLQSSDSPEMAKIFSSLGLEVAGKLLTGIQCRLANFRFTTYLLSPTRS